MTTPATPDQPTSGAGEAEYVPGNDFTECVREGCPAFHHRYGDRLYFQNRNAPLGVHVTPPCASCGEPSMQRIILRGERTPVCLRHLNHWRTPAAPAVPGDEVEALADLLLSAVFGDDHDGVRDEARPMWTAVASTILAAGWTSPQRLATAKAAHGEQIAVNIETKCAHFGCYTGVAKDACGYCQTAADIARAALSDPPARRTGGGEA